MQSRAKVGINVVGRLSMQKNPMSSRHLIAWLLPAPDIPVMITNSVAFTQPCLSCPSFPRPSETGVRATSPCVKGGLSRPSQPSRIARTPNRLSRYPVHNARSLVPLQLFRLDLGSCLPVQETSIARRGPRGSTETYVTKYVAGSAPGAGNVARRS